MKRVLIKFAHGLGDAAQLSCVFQHLKAYRPDWELYLWALRGKHSVGRGHCARYWHDKEPMPAVAFDQVYSLAWPENYNAYPDCPNSKVTNTLREVFGIEPDPALLSYKLYPGEEDRAAGRDYLESIGARRLANGRTNAVCLHYQGNTSQGKKNLSHETATLLVRLVQELGFVPIILDWDKRSPLPDQRSVFNPGADHPLWGGTGTGDALRIAALVEECSLYLGIDSGPQKCAGATSTPSIGLWTGHSPVQFFDLCDNFTHLVPERFHEIPPCQDPRVAAYFVNHYRFRTYRYLEEEATRLIEKRLDASRERRDGLVKVAGFWAPDYKPEQSWIIVEDVYQKDCYKTHLRPRRQGVEYVLDLGANIGCFSKLWHERNPEARIVAVEVNPALVPALEANVGGFGDVVNAACHYGEAGDLHLLDTFGPLGQSLGGSTVVTREQLARVSDPQYLQVPLPAPAVTVESLCERFGFPCVHVLKLDVEGSEFSILEHCDLSRVHTIFLESHGHQRWMQLMARKFPPSGWDIGHLSMGGTGMDYSNWHLINRNFRG